MQNKSSIFSKNSKSLPGSDRGLLDRTAEFRSKENKLMPNTIQKRVTESTLVNRRFQEKKRAEKKSGKSKDPPGGALGHFSLPLPEWQEKDFLYVEIGVPGWSEPGDRNTWLGSGRISKHDREDLEGSAIDPDLQRANCFTVRGDEYKALLSDCGVDFQALTKRKHTYAMNGVLNKRYAHLEEALVFQGCDPIEGDLSNVPRFKPLHPREKISPREVERVFQEHKACESKPGKKDFIKYETLKGQKIRLFFARVTCKIWQRVADRAGVPMPELPPDPPDRPHIYGKEFWDWVRENPKIAIVAEEGEKKALCLLSLGVVAIGAPGINTPYECVRDENERIVERTLRADLQRFCQRGRKVTIAYDEDIKPTTRKNVAIAIGQLGRLLKKAGTDPHVANWHPGEGKGIDDVAIEQGEARVLEILKKAEKWRGNRDLETLTYEAQTELNARFLPKILVSDRLVCIKSQQGTGKTELIEAYVARALREGRPVIVPQCRKQLARAIAKRVDIPYVSERKVGDMWAFSVCVDSLRADGQAAFDVEQLRGALVVIDEAEQVLWHLFNSKTEVKKHRAKIIRNMIQLLEVCEQCILADADLSDIAVGFAARAMECEPYVILNNWVRSKEEAFHIIMHDGTKPETLWTEIQLAAIAGKKLLIHTSGQRSSSKWGTQSLETYLKRLCPEARILRADSETIANPEHPAYGFVGKLNEELPNWDIVIVSPVLETGVSIDIKGHFDEVYGCFWGTQSADSVVQTMHRLRETAPTRHIWAVPNAPHSKIGNGGYTPKEILDGNKRGIDALTKCLANAIVPGSDANALRTWASLAARHNRGFTEYRETIRAKLEAIGHDVRNAKDEAPADTTPLTNFDDIPSLEEVRDSNYEAERNAIANAPDITDSELRDLEKRQEKTRTERHKERKAKIRKRYAGEPVTPELVKRDDGDWYKQLRTHFNLTIGQHLVEGRDRQTLIKRFEEFGPEDWQPDVIAATSITKVTALEVLKIPELLKLAGTGETISKDMPLVREIFEQVQCCYRDVRALLGGIPNKKPMACIRALLKLVGYELKECGRLGTGKRERLYRVMTPEDGRFKIFERWLVEERERSSLENGRTKPSNIKSTSNSERPDLEHPGLERSKPESPSLRPPDPTKVAWQAHLLMRQWERGRDFGLHYWEEICECYGPLMLQGIAAALPPQIRRELTQWAR